MTQIIFSLLLSQIDVFYPSGEICVGKSFSFEVVARFPSGNTAEISQIKKSGPLKIKSISSDARFESGGDIVVKRWILEIFSDKGGTFVFGPIKVVIKNVSSGEVVEVYQVKSVKFRFVECGASGVFVFLGALALGGIVFVFFKVRRQLQRKREEDGSIGKDEKEEKNSVGESADYSTDYISEIDRIFNLPLSTADKIDMIESVVNRFLRQELGIEPDDIESIEQVLPARVLPHFRRFIWLIDSNRNNFDVPADILVDIMTSAKRVLLRTLVEKEIR